MITKLFHLLQTKPELVLLIYVASSVICYNRIRSIKKGVENGSINKPIPPASFKILFVLCHIPVLNTIYAIIVIILYIIGWFWYKKDNKQEDDYTGPI